MSIPVYLSHATPHTQKLEKLIENVKKACDAKGVECITIKASDIRTNDSISAIKKK